MGAFLSSVLIPFANVHPSEQWTGRLDARLTPSSGGHSSLMLAHPDRRNSLREFQWQSSIAQYARLANAAFL